MKKIKCSACGGDVTINERNGTYICSYCGTENLLPNEELQHIELENMARQKQLHDIEIRREYKKIALVAGIIVIVFIAILVAVKIHNNSLFSVYDAQIYAKRNESDTPYYSKENRYDWTYDLFYATVVVQNAPENTYLTFIWQRNDEVIFEDKIDISYTTKKTFTSALPNNNNDVHTGFYRVDIYLNDNPTKFEFLYFYLESAFD
jgi:hypothetical protein